MLPGYFFFLSVPTFIFISFLAYLEAARGSNWRLSEDNDWKWLCQRNAWEFFEKGMCSDQPWKTLYLFTPFFWWVQHFSCSLLSLFAGRLVAPSLAWPSLHCTPNPLYWIYFVRHYPFFSLFVACRHRLFLLPLYGLWLEVVPQCVVGIRKNLFVVALSASQICSNMKSGSAAVGIGPGIEKSPQERCASYCWTLEVVWKFEQLVSRLEMLTFWMQPLA